MKKPSRTFQLDYWKDDRWYVGRLREIPGVVSQGATLKELEENIQDAYRLVMTERRSARHPKAKTKVIAVPA